MAQVSSTPDAQSSATAPDGSTPASDAKAAAPVDVKSGARGQKDTKEVESCDAKGADESDGAAAKPEPEPEISLHKFLRVSGVQPDQSAGFVRWAQKNLGGRYGLTTWKQALADFWRSPAR